jgi:hypothetical protein
MNATETSMTGTDTDDFRTTFEIPAENMDKFNAQIEKLSKKSLKLLGLPITPYVFGYEMREIDGHKRKVFQVMLTAEVPKLNGWDFAARIDHSNETGNIIRPVPNLGYQIPESYRTCDPACDHCKVRRYRRDTFLLHNAETGEFQQVGATCLKDFFGHDPIKVAKMAELLGYAYECGRSGEQVVGIDWRYIDLESYLAHTAAIIRKLGWVSKATARETDKEPTCSLAWSNLTYRDYGDAYDNYVYVDVTDEDRETAAAALEWAQGLCEKCNQNDYEHNICVIAKALVIEGRSTGLAASIVSSYLRDLNRGKLRAAATASLKNSQHLGEVNTKVAFKGVVLKFSTKDGMYGTTYIYRFLTEDGNVVVWFASNHQSVNEGDKVSVKGTIKKNDEYEGVKNTVVTRCTVKALGA